MLSKRRQLKIACHTHEKHISWTSHFVRVAPAAQNNLAPPIKTKNIRAVTSTQGEGERGVHERELQVQRRATQFNAKQFTSRTVFFLV